MRRTHPFLSQISRARRGNSSLDTQIDEGCVVCGTSGRLSTCGGLFEQEAARLASRKGAKGAIFGSASPAIWTDFSEIPEERCVLGERLGPGPQKSSNERHQKFRKHLMHSSLFDFSGVKNVWAKVALGRVKNIRISHPKLHSFISGLFHARIASFWYTPVD